MKNLVRSIVSLSLLAAVAVVVVSAQSEPVSSGLSEENSKVLKRWLDAQKLKLRSATITDFQDLDALSQARAEWGNDYYPYYRVGDFNRDGKDDFAAVLIDPASKEKGRFSIVVFHGGMGDNKAPALFERGKDLSKSGLFESVGLVVMSLSNHDDCVIHIWDGKRYLVKTCVTPPANQK